MKKLILGFILLISISAFGAEYTGRLLNASCNTKHGIGEAQFAIYDEGIKSFTLTSLNVVNDHLCKKGAIGFTSRLVDMSMSSIFGGNTNTLQKFNVNSLGIVKNIDEIELRDKKLKKLYSKLNLLKLNDYHRTDFRIIALEKIDWEKETIERIPGFLEMAQIE